MSQSISASASVSILEHIGCLYLPADNVRRVYIGTRSIFLRRGIPAISNFSMGKHR